MNQQQLDKFNQHFHLESKLIQATESKLEKLEDYHLEDNDMSTIEDEYHDKCDGDYVIDYQNSIYYTENERKVKNVKTTQDVIQFIENEMTAWLEQNT